LSTVTGPHPVEEPRLLTKGHYARMMAFYGLFYTTIGVFAPYFNLYLQHVGLTSTEIGLVLSVPPLMALLFQPVWGLINDRFSIQRQSVGMAILAAPLISLLLLLRPSFLWLMGTVACLALFQTGVTPVMDSLTIQQTGVRNYGKVRMFGSLGWALASVTASLIYSRNAGIGHLPELYLFAGVMAFLGLMGYPFPRSKGPKRSIRPVEPPLAESEKSARERSTDAPLPWWKRARFTEIQRLLRNRPFLLVLAFIFLVSTSQIMNSNFYSLYYRDMGHPMSLLGVIYALGALSELPFFYVVGGILERFGPRKVFVVGGSVFCFRWIVLAFGPPTWALFLLQMLHGISFSFTFAAGVALAAEVSHVDNRATAQSVYSAVNMGLAAITGSILGGVVLGDIGPRGVYEVASVLCFAGLVSIVVLMMRTGSTQKGTS
jgi:PPP family 3-phenylpropionic acid transporter